MDTQPEFVNGALLDERPDQEKLKDYTLKEMVSAADPVNWVEKQPDQWRKFPIFNQDGSGSCVAQTESKELGIMRFLKDGVYVHFSATDIYQRRANKPGSGMNAADARKIVSQGATLEVLSPSQNMTDAQMDAAVVEQYKHDVGAVFAVPNYLALPTQDVETIASVIQRTQKGVMVWFYFKIDEWTAHPQVIYPSLTLADPTSLKHSVTAVDFCLVNGKKSLIIEDSWGSSFGVAGQRVIDEDFFKARNWYASYLLNFKFDQQATPTPHFIFANDLYFGMTDFADISALQDILKYEGLFPTNSQSTGYFGAITQKAVQQFQLKYGIVPATDPGFGRVGPHTRAKLNELYGR